MGRHLLRAMGICYMYRRRRTGKGAGGWPFFSGGRRRAKIPREVQKIPAGILTNGAERAMIAKLTICGGGIGPSTGAAGPPRGRHARV